MTFGDELFLTHRCNSLLVLDLHPNINAAWKVIFSHSHVSSVLSVRNPKSSLSQSHSLHSLKRPPHAHHTGRGTGFERAEEGPLQGAPEFSTAGKKSKGCHPGMRCSQAVERDSEFRLGRQACP